MNYIQSTYRVFQSSWGIYIEMVAGYTSLPYDHDQRHLITICDGVYMDCNQIQSHTESKLLEEEMMYLSEGLRNVSSLVVQHSIHQHTLIVIQSIQWSDCDFQAAGLTAAMMTWTAKAFQFQDPSIDVQFDKAKNQYVFCYEL